MDRVSPLQIIVDLTNSSIKNCNDQLKGLNIILKKLAKVKKRLKKKSKDTDFIGLVVDGQIREIESEVKKNKDKIKTFNDFLEILNGYDYEVEKKESEEDRFSSMYQQMLSNTGRPFGL
jgi:chromosome segregation ATPase